MNDALRAFAAAGVLAAALMSGCGSSDSSDDGAGGERKAKLPQGGEPFKLDPADFSTKIDNPYWPMAPGSRWTYREREEGAVKRVVVTVTGRTKNVAAGIEARVVHDLVTEDGETVEDTDDWYAQDRAGNIWYLGEDTTEFEDGKPTTKKGSWEAGVDGAQAGVLMPADPRPGLAYRQEYYKGEAEDRGRVLALDERITVPFGRFSGVLATRDSTPLEPRATERKYYARGVGPILAVPVFEKGSREELVRFVKGRG